MQSVTGGKMNTEGKVKKMTRKDYVKFAAMLKLERETYGNIVELGLIIDSIADIFAADNPRFDRERFAKACKVS